MSAVADDHVESTCRLGQGPATCAFLVMAPDVGLECAKGGVFEGLLRARLAAGTMVARGDNCDGWMRELARRN